MVNSAASTKRQVTKTGAGNRHDRARPGAWQLPRNELLAQAPAIVHILRGRDHVFEYFHPIGKRYTGGRDLTGLPVRRGLPELEGKGYFEMLDRVYDTGRSRRQLAQAFEMADSRGQTSLHYFDITYKPWRDDKGAIAGVIIFGVDVTAQVKARRQAELNETYFKTAFEQTAVGIAHTAPDGRWLRVNRRLCRILGYSRQELLKMRFWDVTHPEDMELSRSVAQKIQSGAERMLTIEKRYLKKNGQTVWAKLSVSPYRDSQGQFVHFISVIEDVTRQKKAERALRESQERFLLAQQAANIGSFEWHPGSGRFIVTRQVERLYGLAPAAFNDRYQQWLKQVKPADRPRIRSEMKRAAAGGRLDTEFRITCPSGEERWLAVRARYYDGRPGGEPRVLGIIRNVSKRKTAELALQESEHNFRQLADSMPQIVWTARPDGYLDYYNRRWYEYTGFNEGFGDNSWLPILHPDDVQICLDTWYRSVRTGQPYQIEYRFHDRHSPGQYRWFLGRALPVRNNRGKIVKWFGTCTDINDTKQSAERQRDLEVLTDQLREQHAQLLTLNEAKDEFISLASHQLRTPATGVKQYIGMLLEGYAGQLTARQQAMLRYAYDSNERQLSIVDDLLKVARVDAGKVKLNKATCTLCPLVRSVIRDQLSNFRRRRQKISFEAPDQNLKIKADSQLLHMVLDNLIDNASKYTPPGKPIKIRVGLDRTTPTPAAFVTITDSGVGIAASDRQKLFQKFSRIDNPLSRSVGGSGLGLYWVKKIVDLHRGRIKVTSRLNQGTTFRVTLPVA